MLWLAKLWSSRKRENIRKVMLHCLALLSTRDFAPLYSRFEFGYNEHNLASFLLVSSLKSNPSDLSSSWLVFRCHVKSLITMNFLSLFWYHVSVYSIWVSFLSSIHHNFSFSLSNRCFDVSSLHLKDTWRGYVWQSVEVWKELRAFLGD